MTGILSCLAALLASMAASRVYAAKAMPHDGEANAAALSPQLRLAWVDIQGKLDQILERRDREESLPAASLLPSVITETKTSNRRRIDALLDSLANAMLSSPAYDDLKGIRALEEKIAVLRERERRLRDAVFSAPDSKPIYRIDVDTANDLRQKAALCAEEAAEAERGIERSRQAIADELRSWGVDLSPAQQELLFASVIGDDMLRNSIVLKNVRIVLEQMAAHVATESRDPRAPRRYYGSYLSFIDILMNLNRAALANIRVTWLPRLDAIMEKAGNTMVEAKKAVRSGAHTPRQEKTFEANIKANRLTMKVGELYRDFLARQAETVEKRLRELLADRAASQNTYDTVVASSELSELIQRGLRDLDSLEAVVLPEFQLFENFEQQREFAELSSRMLSHPL